MTSTSTYTFLRVSINQKPVFRCFTWIQRVAHVGHALNWELLFSTREMSLLPVPREEEEGSAEHLYTKRESFAAAKRRRSVYSQRQSIKPNDDESIAAAERKISLNPNYAGKQLISERKVSLTQRERLSKACHRPVIVPMVKIVGKVPGFVDVGDLQALRKEVHMI